VSSAAKKAVPTAKKVAVKRGVPQASRKVAKKSARLKGLAKKAASSLARESAGTVAES
jgi:hypothetical protein